MSSAYRTAHRPSEPPPTDHGHADRELLPVFGLIWLVSVAHVVGVLERHASFGTEDTLALVSIFLLPALVKAPLRGIVRRAPKRRR